MVLKKLKLNQLSNDRLKARELALLKGSGTPGDCNCGCNGPSSITANCDANTEFGYTSGGSGPCCNCTGSWNSTGTYG
jgi:natural product precursor